MDEAATLIQKACKYHGVGEDGELMEDQKEVLMGNAQARTMYRWLVKHREELTVKGLPGLREDFVAAEAPSRRPKNPENKRTPDQVAEIQGVVERNKKKSRSFREEVGKLINQMAEVGTHLAVVTQF
jgi:hypothetical protein